MSADDVVVEGYLIGAVVEPNPHPMTFVGSMQQVLTIVVPLDSSTMPRQMPNPDLFALMGTGARDEPRLTIRFSR